MLILKEFCINKGSHSKKLVNQPTLMFVPPPSVTQKNLGEISQINMFNQNL